MSILRIIVYRFYPWSVDRVADDNYHVFHYGQLPELREPRQNNKNILIYTFFLIYWIKLRELSYVNYSVYCIQ